MFYGHFRLHHYPLSTLFPYFSLYLLGVSVTHVCTSQMLKALPICNKLCTYFHRACLISISSLFSCFNTAAYYLLSDLFYHTIYHMFPSMRKLPPSSIYYDPPVSDRRRRLCCHTREHPREHNRHRGCRVRLQHCLHEVRIG